ncbi:MAG: NADH-quinone oxidoreductase subunit C [Chloroflexi bacterium]|nr:NADH-quinone oxidoreductase subunit C [Chloroflexota bacterium]|tara:strand:+ start:24388 stop:24834 length:447 start_codon:yes stop_codon:yes gene_type:complete
MTLNLVASDVAGVLREFFPDNVLHHYIEELWVDSNYLFDLCKLLKENKNFNLEYLVSITCVDYVDRFQLVYHMKSIEYNHSLVVKTDLIGRDSLNVSSVINIWPAADLQEREIWDLMGIHFTDHPNLKRIMTWEGFEGHPLRKDHLGG